MPGQSLQALTWQGARRGISRYGMVPEIRIATPLFAGILSGMSSLPWLVACAFPLVSLAAERSYIGEFNDARALEQSDPERATEGMLRSFRLAVSAGNADYAMSAGLTACFLIHDREKIVAAGKLAREVIDALEPLPTNGANNDVLRRAQLFGFLETGLQMEGNIGEAWRANRAVAETLRGKKISATADGSSITVNEAIRMQTELRSLGWRLLKQEADLLDITGRTVEARSLLDEAAAFLGKEWPHLTSHEQFYAFQLLERRAMILDFLGYEQAAIQAERDLVALGDGNPNLGRSPLVLQCNLLRNLSQWEGPSQEILAQAREIGNRLKAQGSSSGVDRLLAKMELDLHASQQALGTLRADAADNANLGHLFDAVYAERDALVSRAAQGEDGLDAEFTRLLARMRAQGNKRGEPNLYREYGNYLLKRQRPAEAIAMFTEAVRLTRSFGWTLHEPALLSALFNARMAAGDLAGARATLAELENFLHEHADLPDARRVAAEVCRAIALARLGDKDAAKAALELARQLAIDLPDYKKRWLTPEAATGILLAAPTPATPAAIKETPPLRVSPLEVVSIARPGDAARTRFTVINPTVMRIQGQWEIQGPGALATATGGAIRCEAGKPPLIVRIPATLATGSQAALGMALTATAGVGTAQVRVAWQNADQGCGPAATWDVRWDAAATGSVVLDASSLEANPFCYVSLFHELAVPAGEDLGIPFRLRSPVPLRFEYYDSSSQHLLAIDANGNGDFTEAGDLHVRGPSGVAAAIVPATSAAGNLTVEVHIFAVDGQALPPEPSALQMVAEVYRDGAWVKEAEDILK